MSAPILNFTFSAFVFAHGQKDIELIGPVAELEQETADLQLGFWQSR
ncbi:hypothetical protein ACX1NX_12680 [Acinetobacter sp. ANC 5383]